MSEYGRQVDPVELSTPEIDIDTIPPKPEPLTGWNKARSYVVFISIVLSFTCLCIALFFVGAIIKLRTTYAIANTASAVYITPIILRTFCSGGSWVAYIGVTYDTGISSYGWNSFYPFVVCDNSLSNLQNKIQGYLPNQTTTVWFYPENLPATYVSDPYVPISDDPIFIWFLIMMGFVGQVFIIVPINLIMVKCFGFKTVGPNVCCGPFVRCM